MPQVSLGWVFYVLMLGYLCGWTARHFDTKSTEANWFAVKIIWIGMGGITIFILGWTLAGISLYK